MKIKHWLIKQLGGYVEQFASIPHEPVQIEMVTRPIEIIQGTFFIPFDTAQDPTSPMVVNALYTKAFSEINNYLRKNHAVEIHVMRDTPRERLVCGYRFRYVKPRSDVDVKEI